MRDDQSRGGEGSEKQRTLRDGGERHNDSAPATVLNSLHRQQSSAPSVRLPAVLPRVSRALQRACASPCTRLAVCARVTSARRSALAWCGVRCRHHVDVRAAGVPGRGGCLRKTMLAVVGAAASWRPLTTPSVAAVVGRASPARVSRVSIFGRAAPWHSRWRQRGWRSGRVHATSVPVSVRCRGGRLRPRPLPPRGKHFPSRFRNICRESCPVAVPQPIADSRAEPRAETARAPRRPLRGCDVLCCRAERGLALLL